MNRFFAAVKYGDVGFVSSIFPHLSAQKKNAWNVSKKLAAMQPHHKIIDILWYFSGQRENASAYWLLMDCPVQPKKIVVVRKGGLLNIGDIFDPHFSNESVVARFMPNDEGWKCAVKFVRTFND